MDEARNEHRSTADPWSGSGAEPGSNPVDRRGAGPAVDPPFDPWADATAPLRAAEPPLRLAWAPTALVALLIAIYFWQAAVAVPEAPVLRYGFVPAAAARGDGFGVVTALFIHGSWSHVLINSAFLLAFGSPVARRFGGGAKGGLLFLVFFLVCGIAGNLGYGLAHPGGTDPVVGASGGIAGLVAAASRLLSRRAGSADIAPITSPPVITMGAALITMNVLVGLMHITAGMGDNSAIAWETHVAGYVAGLMLMGPFDRLGLNGRTILQRRKD